MGGCLFGGFVVVACMQQQREKKNTKIKNPKISINIFISITLDKVPE